MGRDLHIACLQTRPQPTMEGAIEEVAPLLEAAASVGAQMVFLPEYCGGLRSDGARFVPPTAPEASHPVLAGLRELAAQSGVWVNVGSIAIDGPTGGYLNRGYMIDAAGEIVDYYDKIHLFDVDMSAQAVFRESDTVAPGASARVFDTSWGRVGHAICSDLRFPHLFRDMAQAGAEVLCCPAAFTKTTGEAHWRVSNRARAIENTRYVVSACAVGPVPGGGEAFGHSLVVDPWGHVVADGGAERGVVHARLDLDRVAADAGRIPSLRRDRRYARPANARRSVA